MDGQGGDSRNQVGGAMRLLIILGMAAFAGTSLQTGEAVGLDHLSTLSEAGIEPALSWVPGPVDVHQGATEGPVRLRVYLEDQTLLRRGAKPGADLESDHVARGIQGAARANPADVTQLEAAAAKRMEKSRSRDIRRLYAVAPRVQEQVRRIEGHIQALGGRVLTSELLPASLVTRIDRGLVDELVELPGVGPVSREPQSRPLLDVSHQVVGAPIWWSAGHSGGTGPEDVASVDVAILSEAADLDHPAFDGVDVVNQSGLAPSDHGTHTGGVIASSDAMWTGVAKGIDTLIGAGTTEYALGFPGDTAGVEDPAEVLNLSFGSPAASDDDGLYADLVVTALNSGRAEAAGNEHTEGAGPTVNNIGRNTLSAAAYADANTLSAADDFVASFSSRGPSPGGRKKPDLTAPGVSIMAPSAHWDAAPGNPLFTPVNGTSFSTPHVAGAMAILAGAGILDPMIQRAVLINSARDWNGLPDGLNGWVAQTGWRPEVGWGALDLTRALAERGNYQTGAVRGGEAAYFAAQGLEEGEKSTLAFELRGYWPNYPQPGSQPVVFTQSNLDLRQYHEGGEEEGPPDEFVPPAPGERAGPDAVDPNDTVEQVRAPIGADQMILKVEAVSEVLGVEKEPFAITSAVPLVKLMAPKVEPTAVDASTLGPVRCGSIVTISARATNVSPDLGAEGAKLLIDLPSGVDLVEGAHAREVSDGELGASEESEPHSWKITPTENGTHTVRISGYGEAYGTGVEEFAPPLKVKSDCQSPETTIVSGPEGRTNIASPSFTFSSSEAGGSYRCALNTDPLAPCGSREVFPSLPDAEHTVRVQAVDRAGNADPTPAKRTFTVDTTVLRPKLVVRSPRLRTRGQSIGVVRIGLGERGGASVRAKVRRGGRATRIRARTLTLDGKQRLKLRVPRGVVRRLDRALRNQVRLRVEVNVVFSDELGNKVSRALRYRLR